MAAAAVPGSKQRRQVAAAAVPGSKWRQQVAAAGGGGKGIGWLAGGMRRMRDQ